MSQQHRLTKDSEEEAIEMVADVQRMIATMRGERVYVRQRSVRRYGNTLKKNVRARMYHSTHTNHSRNVHVSIHAHTQTHIETHISQIPPTQAYVHARGRPHMWVSMCVRVCA